MGELIILQGSVAQGGLGCDPQADQAPLQPPTHLAADVLVDEHVLPFVIKDNVDLLCAGSADVRACEGTQGS